MNSKKDIKDIFETDSTFKGILTMAIPTIISQMITVLYNYADTIFIGQLNDPLQSAAIALALWSCRFHKLGHFSVQSVRRAAVINIMVTQVGVKTAVFNSPFQYLICCLIKRDRSDHPRC